MLPVQGADADMLAGKRLADWRMPVTMQLGSEGANVQHLQEALRRLGADVTADGYFGLTTDRAIRVVQRKYGVIPPDGSLTDATMLAITAHDPDQRPDAFPGSGDVRPLPFRSIGRSQAALIDLSGVARQAAHLPAITSMPAAPATMGISDAGLKFIEAREELAGVTNRLHFPGGASGVTLGPGYDMKERSQNSIQRDLEAINIDRTRAVAASQGSGKTGDDARKFAKDNKYLLNLSSDQQAALLGQIIGTYEDIVQRRITRWLYQWEFDALVSFAYNPGGQFGNVAHSVNLGRYAEAVATIRSANKSRNPRTHLLEVMSGLTERRRREVILFLYGEYDA